MLISFQRETKAWHVGWPKTLIPLLSSGDSAGKRSPTSLVESPLVSPSLTVECKCRSNVYDHKGNIQKVPYMNSVNSILRQFNNTVTRTTLLSNLFAC